MANVERLIEQIDDGRSQIEGYAALALAREAATRSDLDKVRAWLERARGEFSLPDQIALMRYWEGRLVPGVADPPSWLPEMEALFAQSRVVCEAEILTYLFVARRLAAGTARGVAGGTAQREAVRFLDRAYERAIAANNRTWVERIDRVCNELDPAGMSERLIQRFSGRPSEEIRRTRTEVATIVFADVVGFSPRALELSPEEVMVTVRSFFELAVPLLSHYRVRPLSCLGDGLLAVCQDEGHEARGLGFARHLVRRAARATMVRKQALHEKYGLDIRCGVASGPVVMGTLGNLFKLEFAAIGLTTNLAARLQAKAEPSEVVAAWETAGEIADEGTVEMLALKGFEAEGGKRAVRFKVLP